MIKSHFGIGVERVSKNINYKKLYEQALKEMEKSKEDEDLQQENEQLKRELGSTPLCDFCFDRNELSQLQERVKQAKEILSDLRERPRFEFCLTAPLDKAINLLSLCKPKEYTSKITEKGIYCKQCWGKCRWVDGKGWVCKACLKETEGEVVKPEYIDK